MVDTMGKIIRFASLIIIALGIALLVFSVFAKFDKGRAYWGNGMIVDYEYPYAKYALSYLIAGSASLIFGVILFSVVLKRRQKPEEKSKG